MSCRRAAGKGISSRIKHLVPSFLCSSSRHSDCGDTGLAERLTKPHHEEPIGSLVMRRARNVFSWDMRSQRGPVCTHFGHKRGALKRAIATPNRKSKEKHLYEYKNS